MAEQELGNAITPEPPGARYEADLDRACRVAAWCGDIARNPEPISFSTLLIGLLTVQDWFRELAAGAGVQVDEIYSAKDCISPDQRRRVLKEADSGRLPSADRLFSPSAQAILRAAARRAGARLIGTHHVLAAYIFDTPPGHQRQMSAWGLQSERFLVELGRAVSQQWPGEPFEGPPMSGAGNHKQFQPHDESAPATPPAKRHRPAPLSAALTQFLWEHDLTLAPAARTILSTAEYLGQHRRVDNGQLTTSLILLAMIATADALQEFEDGRGPAALGSEVRNRAGNRLGKLWSEYFERPPDVPPVDAIPESKITYISPNANEVLQAAAGKVDETGAAVIRGDGLAIALLDRPRGRARDRLRSLNADADVLRSTVARATGSTATSVADPVAVPDVIPPTPSAADPSISPPTPTDPRRAASYVASYTADDPLTPGAADLLGVEAEAEAFARLTASTEVSPPLSFGIFGDWGTGKTFFMNRVYEHVRRLGISAGDGVMFHRDVVQIRFNAWHYIESNLWASLVEFIFVELDRWLRAQGVTPEQVEAVFERLDTAQKLKLEAIDELIQARKERRAAEKHLVEARSDFEKALVVRSAASPDAFWCAVKATFYARLSEPAARRRLAEAAERLGVPALIESARELHTAMGVAAGQAGRTNVLMRAFLLNAGRWPWVCAFAMAILVVPSLLLLLREAAGGIWPWLREVNAIVIGFSSMLAAAAGVLGAIASRASRGLDLLESFRDHLDSAIQEEAGRPNVSLAEAERQVAETRAAVERAEHAVVDAGTRADAARRELEQTSAQGRLNRFIREKVVSGDYAKHLGIVASIRKDFGQLADLMLGVGQEDGAREEYRRAAERHRTRLEDLIAGAGDSLSPNEKQEFRSTIGAPGDLPRPFRRIVLYIDDLDRCPANKVVEVLQAVHLLLGFPLFVVLVAVDARWLTRSLEDRYPDLLTDPGAGEPSGTPAASPQDYLEKIFQIPYWVRPMDAQASKQYVGTLVQADVMPRANPSPGPGATRPDSVFASPAPAGSVQSSIPRVTPAEEESTTQSEHVTEAQATVNGTPGKQDMRQQTPVRMALTSREAELMVALAPFVGRSPRRGLRFVNTYRLVRTSLPDDDGTFTGEDGRDYNRRALLGGLAIVCGSPKLAPTFFTVLRDLPTTHSGVASIRSTIASDPTVTSSQEWPNLDGVLNLLSQGEEPDGAHMVDSLRAFAGVAARYSFIPKR